MTDLSQFQRRFLATLAKRPNGHCSTSELAVRMKTSRLAVVSAGRALERAGKVGCFRSGNDQWAAQMWAIRHAAAGVDTSAPPPPETLVDALQDRAHPPEKLKMPEWPEGAYFIDAEGNFYNEQAEPLEPVAGVAGVDGETN